MTRYVALLRGINVGGQNLIRMVDLKARFEDAGFRDVATYIQSGNVLFDGGDRPAATLAVEIEGLLARAFEYRSPVAIRSRAQMVSVVDGAPPGFADPARYRSDVIYLIPPLAAPTVVGQVPQREGVDEIWAGSDVLYVRRLASRASQSRLSKLVSLPIYQQMTIRNWNTTVKLRELLDR
jgi:uncharacterized protein (DUF1697 family)